MIYDIHKTFHENISQGFTVPAIPVVERKSPEVRIFDYTLQSRVGLFACPLSATAQGVALASQLGFDVITWKTIRSKACEPHPWPNVTYVASAHDGMKAVREKTKTLANSIGNASYELEPTLAEIKKGLVCLQQGQILIISIYGTGQTRKEIIDDFVYLAQRVNEMGVHAIELNCSCPNVSGVYYKDPEFMYELINAVFRNVSIPITIKVGLHDSYEQLKQLLSAIANASGRGITGINAMGMQVLNEQGMPFFGEKRLYAGISGDAIRSRALKWAADAASINKECGLGLTIFAGGGVVAPTHFDQFLNAGAHVGMTTTGVLLDPYIAMNYHRIHYEKRNSYTVARSEHVI